MPTAHAPVKFDVGSAVSLAAALPDGGLVLGLGDYAEVWTARGRRVATLFAPAAVTALHAAREGGRVFVGCEGSVVEFDVATAGDGAAAVGCCAYAGRPDAPVAGIAELGGGTHLCAAVAGPHVRVWERKSRAAVAVKAPFFGWAAAIVAVDADTLVTAGVDRSARVWRVDLAARTATCVASIAILPPSPVRSLLALRAGGVAVSHRNGEAWRWNLADGEACVAERLQGGRACATLTELANGRVVTASAWPAEAASAYLSCTLADGAAALVHGRCVRVYDGWAWERREAAVAAWQAMHRWW